MAYHHRDVFTERLHMYLRKSDIFPYYRKTVDEFEAVYALLRSNFQEGYVDDLMKLRNYFDEPQRQLIANMELGCCHIDDATELGDLRKELGLVSDSDTFLLNDRYIIPVEDIEGAIVALIGYYPDYKKYITTPSPFFSKECMFFNFRQAYELSWKEYNGFVIVVEGIFDCLSLRAIGLPAMATMGSSVSKNKGELLKLFNKVLGIPDDDKTGHKAINRYSERGWQVPSNTTMLKFHGGEFDLPNGEQIHCKDMDNFVSWYNADDVREILLSFADSKEEIEELYI